MAKKKIPTINKNKALESFIEKGIDKDKQDQEGNTPEKWHNKAYKEKKYKGRSISMSDSFYDDVKQFVQDNSELGSISQLTVRALHEFMKRYANER